MYVPGRWVAIAACACVLSRDASRAILPLPTTDYAFPKCAASDLTLRLPSTLGPLLRSLRQSARELLERTRDDEAGRQRCDDDGAMRSPTAHARADSRSDSDGDTESRCTSSSPQPREAQQHIQIPQPRKSYPTIDKALVPTLNLHRLAPPFPSSDAVQAAHRTEAGGVAACEEDDADVEQVYFEARIPACYVLQPSCHLLCEGLQADIRFWGEGTPGENGGVVAVAARKVDAPLSAAERAALRQVRARAYSCACVHTNTHHTPTYTVVL